MATIKESKTSKKAKEIISLQTDIILIETTLSKSKHQNTIDSLNSLKNELIQASSALVNEQGN